MGLKFAVFGGLEEENTEHEWQDPLGNQSPLKHIIQSKKCGDTPKNVFSRTHSCLARKV